MSMLTTLAPSSKASCDCLPRDLSTGERTLPGPNGTTSIRTRSSRSRQRSARTIRRYHQRTHNAQPSSYPKPVRWQFGPSVQRERKPEFAGDYHYVTRVVPDDPVLLDCCFVGIECVPLYFHTNSQFFGRYTKTPSSPIRGPLYPCSTQAPAQTSTTLVFCLNPHRQYHPHVERRLIVLSWRISVGEFTGTVLAHAWTEVNNRLIRRPIGARLGALENDRKSRQK